MKKTIILLSILFIAMNTSIAANIQNPNNDRPIPPPRLTKEEMAKREAAFEQRLGLTEKQKQQAKELRIKGHEQMKPIMDNLITKKHEIHKLKQTNTDAEKLNQLNTEIQDLEKNANEIRKNNMKDFEAILTPEQKKILKEMKQEGRKKYQEAHRNTPAFNQNKGRN